MRVESLSVESFRNYERAALTLAPGLNLVVGRNAQGKTNLLEAVHLLSGLGSPRGPDASVVKDGSDRAFVHGEVSRGPRKIRLDLEIQAGKGTRALVNQTPVPGTRALTESLVCVFFGPDELAIVKGSPDRRRRFLDDLAVKLRPARDSLRRDFERVLRQRNALLRSAPRRSSNAVPETLRVWDESLCRTGAAVTKARLDVLVALAPFVQKRYEGIAGGGRVELSYASAWLEGDPDLGEDRIAEALAAAIETQRPRELERGMTLVGPHRDDLEVMLASGGIAGADLLSARSFASQGDQRTCALALRLGEFDLVTETLGEEPVLLLDDVFSELDPARRAWLSDSVRGAGQTIVTSAEPGAAEAARPELVIEVEGGALVDHG